MPQTIRINDFNCRYELYGNKDSKKAIVFLNGIASPLESWGLMVPLLKNDYKMLCFDHRGQWFSEVTPPPYTFKQLAHDTAALMDALEIEEAHIVGTSLGGEIGLMFALEYPQRCKTLTIIASVSEIHPVLAEQVKRWRALAQEAVDIYSKTDEITPELNRDIGHRFFTFFLADSYSNDTFTNDAVIIKNRDASFQNLAHRDFYQGHIYLADMFMGLIDEEKLTDRLCDIKCPTLLVAGGQDILKPPSYSEIMAERIPNCDFVIFQQAAHAVAVEKAVEITDLCIGMFNRSEK